MPLRTGRTEHSCHLQTSWTVEMVTTVCTCPSSIQARLHKAGMRNRLRGKLWRVFAWSVKVRTPTCAGIMAHPHLQVRIANQPDQPSQVRCETCSDDFCEVCFAAQHRKGTRKRHATIVLSGRVEKRVKLSENGVKKASSMNDDQVCSFAPYNTAAR